MLFHAASRPENSDKVLSLFKRYNMDTPKKIDYVLSIVYNHWKINEPFFKSELRQLRKRVDNFDMEALNPVEKEGAIDLLCSDGYVKRVHENGVTNFHITIQGILFYEAGGYSGQIKSKDSEKARLLALERNQTRNANRMTALTVILTVFTVLSVFITSLEKFHVVFRLDIWLSFFLFCSGILFGVLASIIITIKKKEN